MSDPNKMPILLINQPERDNRRGDGAAQDVPNDLQNGRQGFYQRRQMLQEIREPGTDQAFIDDRPLCNFFNDRSQNAQKINAQSVFQALPDAAQTIQCVVEFRAGVKLFAGQYSGSLARSCR
jgi:hypothetical protein